MDTALITFMVYVITPVPLVLDLDIAFASHPLRRISICFRSSVSSTQDLKQEKVKKGQCKRNMDGEDTW
jgi:hypothetical protein